MALASLRNQIIGYSIAVIIVLFMIWITFSSLRSQEKELITIRKAREVLLKLGPLEVDLKDFESALNSLLVFKKENSDEYNEGLQKIRNDSAVLVQLAESHPKDREAYHQLAGLLHQMTEFAEHTLYSHQKKDFDTLNTAWNPNAGKEIPAAFRTTLEQLEAESRQVLSTSYNNTINLTRKIVTYVGIISAILIIILIISFFLIYRNIRNREREEERLRTFNEELEKQVGIKTAEIKRAAEQILKEKNLSDSVIDSLPGIFYLRSHTTGKCLRWNKNFQAALGVTSEEIMNSKLFDFVADEDKKAVAEEAEKVKTKGFGSMEAHIKTKNGNVPYFITGISINYENQPCLMGMGIDITERKRAEEEKDKARYLLNERIKELTTLYQAGQILQSEDKSVEEVLQEIVSILPSGWQYKDVAAARIVLNEMEFLTPNFRQGIHKQTAEFPVPDGTKGIVEIVYLEQRPPAEEGAFLTEERDLINMIAEMIRVYLARNQAKKELIKSEANLKTIFETTDDGYALLDENFGIISYNQRGLDFVTNELKGKPGNSNNLIDFLPPDRRSFLLDLKERVLESGHANYEISYLQPDSSYKWYYIRMFTVTNIEKKVLGLMMAVTDISEKKLMEQEMLNNKIQEQKRVTRAILKAEERERNKIGQELHDNINQILASVKLYLGMAKEKEGKSMVETIKESTLLLDNAIQEIRSLSKSQVTPLKGIDLKELIQSLVDKLDESTAITTRFEYTVNNKYLEDDLKLNIYRIVQEQINNILKYAEASHVNILINAGDRSLHLAIEDDGKGFDPDKKRKGIGISNMTNRAESFNGKLLLESSPGNGCALLVRIPC